MAEHEPVAESYTDDDARKLGLAECRDADVELMAALHALLQVGEVDMTLFFRALADLDPAAPSLAPFDEAFYAPERRAAVEAALLHWLQRYGARVARDARPAAERRLLMDAVNPRYVLRNYLAQQAIDRAERGDDAAVEELLDVLRRPYDDQPGREAFAQRRPDWARSKPGCSMLSCSS